MQNPFSYITYAKGKVTIYANCLLDRTLLYLGLEQLTTEYCHMMELLRTIDKIYPTANPCFVHYALQLCLL